MSENAASMRLWRLVVCILLLVAAVDVVAVLRITNNHDFAVYYQAAERLRAGQDIYADLDSFRAFIESGQSTKDDETPWPFAYPPFPALLIMPLTLLPYGWASLLWTALCLSAIAMSCILVLHSQHWLALPGGVLVLLLLYQYQPAVVGVRLGQIDIAIFLLIVLAFLWVKQGQQGAAGLALGVAIGVKLFSGFLVAFLLWKRQWKAALIALISGGVFLAGSFVMVGWEGLQRYLDFSSLYTTGAFAGYPYHQSFNAFFTRTFKANAFLEPVAELPWLADVLTVLASGAVLAVLAWVTRRPAPPSGKRFDLEYALAVTAMLLVVPPAPRYAFIWLLLGFIILSARLIEGRGGWWAAAGLVLAYALTARLLYFPVPLLRRLIMDGQFMLGALALFAALAWQLGTSRGEDETE